MSLMKEYRKLPPMGEVYKIAKNSWIMEPKLTCKGFFYESLVKDAKSIYKKNNIQIVLDKHMDYVEQGATCGAEKQLESVNENFLIPDFVASAENINNVN